MIITPSFFFQLNLGFLWNWVWWCLPYRKVWRRSVAAFDDLLQQECIDFLFFAHFSFLLYYSKGFSLICYGDNESHSNGISMVIMLFSLIILAFLHIAELSRRISPSMIRSPHCVYVFNSNFGGCRVFVYERRCLTLRNLRDISSPTNQTGCDVNMIFYPFNIMISILFCIWILVSLILICCCKGPYLGHTETH